MFDSRLPPRVLYKYCPLDGGSTFRDRLGSILIDSKLWFASPLTFNDPFDCIPVIDMTSSRVEREKLIREASKRVLAEMPRSERRRKVRAAVKQARLPIAESEAARAWNETLAMMGVLCLTEAPDDLLMWGHYANSHRGVCIGFNTSELPFVLSQRVEYSHDRPVWHRFRDDYKSALPNILSTKASNWSYEREWRVFRQGVTGKVDFDPRSIAKVIFGARIAPDDEDWVMQRVQTSGYAPDFLQARIDAREYKVCLHRR